MRAAPFRYGNSKPPEEVAQCLVVLAFRTLRATEIGLADEIAAAASMVQGQAAEATPVVLVRGVAEILAKGPVRNAQALIRSRENDLFL